MDFCNHDGVTIEAGEYGPPRVVDAAPVAAFSRELLVSANRDVFVVEGGRITVCGNVVYEVTDWHHRCPGYGDEEMVLARLISRPPQAGDVEMLLADMLATGVSACVVTPRPEEADARCCNGSDDPRLRCGSHHCTDLAEMGGYSCCCGQYWTSKNQCGSGAAMGDRVSLEDRLSEMLAYTVADAPHDLGAHVAGVLHVLRTEGAVPPELRRLDVAEEIVLELRAAGLEARDHVPDQASAAVRQRQRITGDTLLWAATRVEERYVKDRGPRDVG